MTRGTYSPPVDAFAETSALLALMEKRPVDAVRTVRSMLPGERLRFARQLAALLAIVETVSEGGEPE